MELLQGGELFDQIL
jgi:calcium/calmodulin-dependent protein kinase I